MQFVRLACHPVSSTQTMNDYNISVEDLRKKRADLAAIVAVHMFGNPCDMDAINAVADTVPVIEDCAQSIFSTYKGKQTGLLSTASFFSFRCGKYISAGEGSAIFCRELELQKKIERIVNSFESWSTQKMFIQLSSRRLLKQLCTTVPGTDLLVTRLVCDLIKN